MYSLYNPDGPKLLAPPHFTRQAAWLIEQLASDDNTTANNELEPIKAPFPNGLFKFRGVTDNTLKNLHTETLWMAPASSLNDPYDCLLTTAKQKSEEETGSVVGSGGPMTFRVQHDDPYFYWSQVYNETLKRLQALTGVCSFATSSDALNLWAYYAGDYKGICIEYDPTEFSPELQRSLFKVKYGGTFERFNIKSAASVIAAACIKSDFWEHEKEWRLVQFPSDPRGANVTVALPKAIYMGPRILPADRDSIRTFCYDRKIPCFDMVLSFDEFKLKPRNVDETPDFSFTWSASLSFFTYSTHAKVTFPKSNETKHEKPEVN